MSLAWVTDPPQLDDQHIDAIIESITDQTVKTSYLAERNRLSNEKMQKFLLTDYRLKKRIFPEKSQLILKEILNYEDTRWTQLSTVVDRLNSPELVDYYERWKIRWVDWWSLPHWPVTVHYVFTYGEGDCTGIADFTARCLYRAGYGAYEYKVSARRPKDSHHSICIFFIDGVKYAMDNGSIMPNGFFPYED